MAATRWPLVWMYHSVDEYESDPRQVTVRPERFARQMGWLHARGLRGVGTAELAAAHRRGAGHGLVGLTFDDGYRDFLHRAVPVLTRYGFSATVYVVTGLVDGYNEWDRPGPVKPLMDACEIRRAASAGMEIGSHGVRHVRLPSTDAADLHDEVVRSRAELENLIDAPVTGFAYPYGDAGPREIEAVRAAGYAHAVAIRPDADAGWHALPRTFVGERDGGWRLRAKRLRQRLREPYRELSS